MISLVVSIVIAALLLWLASYLPIGEPFQTILRVIGIVVVIVGIVIF